MGAVPVLIALATLAAFLPALQNGWLNWDDDVNFLLNAHIRGLGPAHLRWMFGTVSGHYFPLFYLCSAVNYRLWGLNPFGYHLTNLILHGANAVVFYYLSLRLLSPAAKEEAGADPRLPAALSALLFSLHPLRVESVAWASECPTLLAGFFFMAALLLYLRARPWSALGVFVLSLMSKPIGITLPLILVLLDFYPLRRLPSPKSARVWMEKIPFLLASSASALALLYSRSRPGFSWTLEQFPFVYRMVSALYGLAFYLRQTVFPAHLLPLYMMPIRFYPFSPPFLLSGALVALITAFVILNARRRPAWLAAWIYYVVTLLPLLGFIKSGPYLVTDHYSYLACLSWPILAGAAIRRRRWLAVPGALAALILAGLAWRQTRIWRDPETFWGAMVTQDPNNSIARNFLGEIRVGQGRPAEASEYFKEALTINPGYGVAYNNLGNLMAGQRRYKEAEAYYREAVRTNPSHPVSHFNLAAALLRQGRRREAAAELREAIRLDPDDPEPQRILAGLTRP